MSSLAEFLKERKHLQEEALKRRKELLDEWLQTLKDLFGQIEKWLEPAKKEGLEVRWSEKEISEEYLGTYKAPVLEINFADINVRLEPVARLVLGAYGRVDVYSPLGITKLVRLNLEENKWYLVIEEPNRKQQLTEESWENFLKEAFSAP